MAKINGGKVAGHGAKVAEPKGDPKAGTERDILRSQITADPKFNSRKHSDATKDGGSMEELVASIKANGLLQPIVVRVVEANKYTVVAGFRRFAACETLGWDTVRCSVRSMTPLEARVANLTENITREDLFPGELADAAHTLRVEHKFSGSEIAKLVGSGKGYVNKLLAMRDELDPRIWARCFYRWAAPATQGYLYDLRQAHKDHAKQWAVYCEFTKTDPNSETPDVGAEGQGEGVEAKDSSPQPEKPKTANASKLQQLKEGYVRLRKEGSALGVNLTEADKVALSEYVKILTWAMDTRAEAPLHGKLDKAMKEREKREAAARERDAKEMSES